MIKLFKSRRPAPPAPAEVATADRLIAAYHGKTPEQWLDLPAIVKADLRESVVHAEKFRP